MSKPAVAALAFVVAFLLCGLAAPTVAAASAEASACAPPSVTSSAQIGNAGQPNLNVFLPGSGTMNAIVLFADFPDARAQGAPDALYGLNQFPDASQWFQQTSQGRMNVQFNPVDSWIHLSQSSTSYQVSAGNMDYDHQRALVTDALNASGVNLNGYQVAIVVTSVQSAVRNAEAFIAGSNPPISVGGASFRYGIDIGSSGFTTNLTARIIEHELMHTLGPADLGDPIGKQWSVNYAGGFVGAESLTAWERLQVGWLGLDHVDCVTSSGSTDVKLMPLEQSSGTRAIIVPVAGHYVVAENRELSNEDTGICRQGMLLTNVNPQVDNYPSTAIAGITDPREPVTSERCQFAWDMNGSKLYSDPSGQFKLQLLCHQTDLSYIVRVADGVPMSNAASPLCKGAPPGEQAVQGGNGDHAKFTAKLLSGRCSGSPKLQIKGSVTSAIPGHAYRLQEKLPGSSKWVTVNKGLGLTFTGGFQVTLVLPKVTCKTKSVELRLISNGTPISKTVTLRIASRGQRR